MYHQPHRSSAPLRQIHDTNNLNMYPDENHEPYLEILEHPKARGFRFRYSCEGPSHGGIPGASSDKNKKTYPAVQIRNYTGYARIVVQLVTNEENPRLHPHSLVGKQCQNGICTVQCGPKDMTATFPNLGIQHVTKKNVAKILEERYMAAEMQLSSLNDGLSADVQKAIKEEDRSRLQAKANAEAKSIDLSVVRLMFIAYLPDSNGAFTLMLKPVISDAIFDSKAPNAATLKICRMDKTFGAASGMDEIYLLCDKVQKDDIQVRFYEEDNNGEELWDGYGDFSPTDVHRQFAIVFRTPRYKDVSIQSPVQVQVQLRRRSDGEVSESRPFTYMPVQDDPEQIHRKRRKVNSAYFGDHISGSRPNGSTTQGNLVNSQQLGGGFVFQSNGNNNGGMKQSRLPPPPKAKNPQAGPLDPSVLMRMGTIKREPQSPSMMSDSQNSYQSRPSPESYTYSPMSNPAFSPGASPLSVQSNGYNENSQPSQTRVVPEVPQMIAGTNIPAPRPLPQVRSPPQQEFVPVQQPVNFVGQFVQYPATTSTNDLYFTPTEVTNAVFCSEANVAQTTVVETGDPDLDYLMELVTQAGISQPSNVVTMTSAGAGMDPKYQHGETTDILDLLHNNEEGFYMQEVQCDSTAEEQNTEEPVNEEEFSRGMQEPSLHTKVKIEVTAPNDHIVESDSCTIALREVEIEENHPTKQSERTLSKTPANDTEKNIGSNTTDDMKLNEEAGIIGELGQNALRALLINITKRTARALQDFAATGDIRILLATQRQLTDVQDGDGDTSVHLAVINGQDEVLCALMQLIQTIPGGQEIVNRPNDLQLTPLHIAIYIENVNAVKWLVNAGANIFAGDSKGNTAIHLACLTGQADILEYLLDKATGDIEKPNYNGLTPLHQLANKVTEGQGDRQCIRLLVGHGHNVDAGDMKSGRTALHIAAEENNLIVAGYLLSECNADLESRTFDGLTPLHIAVARDSQEIATLLLACGADPQAEYTEEYESTPATLCASEKMRRILAGEIDIVGSPCHVISSFIEDADDICSLDPLVKMKLCRLLDQPAIGRDWYALAERLGLGTLVGIIEDQEKSPTESLLENYSCIQGSISGLKSALSKLERQDALNILTEDSEEVTARATKQEIDMDRFDSAFGSMTLSEQISIPGC